MEIDMSDKDDEKAESTDVPNEIDMPELVVAFESYTPPLKEQEPS
jgi:hypothetical protein